MTLQQVTQTLKSARSILLTTHRHGDGDGLGAEAALFHTLRLLNKSVRILNVDRPSAKYCFLTEGIALQSFDGPHESVNQVDLAIILDTNDSRLVEPLFSELKNKAKQILFIDHHPLLALAPSSSAEAWIDTDAASTGELCFRLIKSLFAGTQWRLTPEIAMALYASIVFDTQLFRFIRQSASSHLMAAELLGVPFDVESVHRALFATSSAAKLKFLGRAFGRIEYFENDRLAFVSVNQNDLKEIPADDSGDLIDMMIDIDSVEVAALIREDAARKFKVSLRSKGRVPVLPIAELLGGGGHPFAAGAYFEGELADLRQRMITELHARLVVHLGAEQ